MFRLYSMEKNIIGEANGTKFERSDWQITNTEKPPSPISELIYSFDETYVKQFLISDQI